MEAGVLERTPESPQGYEIKMPQVEGWQVNQGLYDSFRETSHNLKVPPEIAQGYFDWYVKFQADADAAEQAEFNTMREKLKTDWGVLHPRKMEAARRAATKYLGQDGDDFISQLPPAIGNRVIRAFSQIGESLLEESFVQGEPQSFESKDTLISKINEIVNSKEFKEGDKGKVDEYLKLNRALSILQVEERR